MNYEELKQRTQSLIGADVDELIERVRLLAVEYGTQKAKVERLADLRKTKLYSIVEERRAEFDELGEKVTEARLEAFARASKDYRGFIDMQYKEKVILVKVEADYFAARNQLDAIQEMMRLARTEFYLNSKN